MSPHLINALVALVLALLCLVVLVMTDQLTIPA
jgi:hypothetical protein